MTDRKALDHPADVDAIDGEVTVNGPGRLGVSLTPKAARETGRRLEEFATEAESSKTKRPPRPE